MRAALGDRIERLPLSRGQAAIALQQLRVADHAVEGRAQFVAHVGQELALRPCRRLGNVLGASQRLVPLQPIGDVAQERPEEIPVVSPHRQRDGDFDRELVAVPMEAAQLEPAIDDRRLAGGEKTLHPLQVRLTKCRRNDRLGEVAAERFFAGPAESLLRLRVPADDEARLVHADERIVGGVENQVGAGIALRHLAERFAAAFIGDRDGDQVRGGDRKVLFVDRPGARLADVLHTQHPDHLLAAPERHVEHGVDVERFEIRREEFARPRIGAGVGGGDHALALDGAEIRRRRLAAEHSAGLVRVLRPPVQSDADQCSPGDRRSARG